MEDLLLTSGSVVSPLVTIYLLWRVGLLGGKKKEEKSDNGVKTATKRNTDDIKTLFDHAEVANGEMGEINKTLVGIQKDIHYIIKRLDK